MHINEQTPESLKIHLDRYFPYTIVWVASAPEISGSLGRTLSLNETMEAQSVFAIASDSPLDRDRILNLLIQKPLDIKKLNAKISVHSFPAIVSPDELFSVDLTLENLSEERWVSLQPHPVHLAYHWLDENGKCIVYDGIRTLIQYPLFQGESRKFFIEVLAPKISGNNILQITLVQESCFWFEKVIQNLPVCLMIKTEPIEK
jgi:hypothetical protein